VVYIARRGIGPVRQMGWRLVIKLLGRWEICREDASVALGKVTIFIKLNIKNSKKNKKLKLNMTSVMLYVTYRKACVVKFKFEFM
jgi:hypothetical protein